MDPQDKKSFQELVQDVSYLRGQFDTVIPLMQKSSENINKLLVKHESRIDAIESDQSNMKGRSAVLGGIAGLFMTTLGEWFMRHIK